MKATVKYSEDSVEANDAKALKDIRDYLSKKQWDTIMSSVNDPTVSCRTLDMLLHFCGVQGYPIFAFMRLYRANEYQAWYDTLLD